MPSRRLLTACLCLTLAAPALADTLATAPVTGIDAAAMDLYLFYSRYSGDVRHCEEEYGCYESHTHDAKDLQLIVGGAIIRF